MSVLFKYTSFPQWFRTPIVMLGFSSAIRMLFFTLRAMHRYTIRSSSLAICGAGEGTWAVVTGGSRGLGREYCFELAKSGFNIVLAARTLKDLEVVAEEIRSLYPSTKTRVIVMDATKADSIHVQAFVDAFSDLDVGIVINNAAVITPIPTEVCDQSDDVISEQVNANVLFTVLLAKRVMPLLKRHARTHRSIFFIVGSLTSTMPMPLYSVYAASKSFLDRFAVGLSCEVAPCGVDVVVCRPGQFVSDMSGIGQSSFAVADAAHMVRRSFRMLGTGVITIPYLPHYIMQSLSDYIPLWFVGPIVRDMHTKIRNDALTDKRA
eukprot:CFRG1549T1